MIRRSFLTVAAAALLCQTALLYQTALADPCGMVPPIYTGPGQPITRVGEQMTYVFYKDGVETFVIRPGFSGKVDEFGMLIPFPSVPALRKVPDHIFPHVQAAVDPPEVVIDLRPRPALAFARSQRASAPRQQAKQGLEYQDRVVVLKKEAVGMYEVAVLEAGSAKALKRWMDDHGYQYPEGMDDACNEYVADGWCFVAVKTKVGQKEGVDPKPAQRNVNSKLPEGSAFDGSVQGMGFRFESDELVVPMRLSAFNAGRLHNIVYIVTDQPQKIRSIPEEYVMRQVSGEALHRNVTGPLPLRIIGGTEKDLTDAHKKRLEAQRNPEPKNGAAKQLFAGDLKAVSSGQLSLEHEEKEKELLAIGERLGLRGGEIDKLHADATRGMAEQATAGALEGLKSMSMTVVDGDFPRDVLAAKNLRFAAYRMPARRNTPEAYDAKLKRGAGEKEGVLLLGDVDWSHIEQSPSEVAAAPQSSERAREVPSRVWVIGLTSLGLLLTGLAFSWNRRGGTVVALLLAGVFLAAASSAFAEGNADADAEAEKPTIRELLNDLSHKEKAEAAVAQLVDRGEEAKQQLKGEVIEGGDLTRRGWAIVALGEIGGDDVDALFKKVHSDNEQPMLVRTWCAAARVAMVDDTDELTDLAPLVQQFPAVGRPLGMRLVEKLSQGEGASAEGLLSVSLKVSQLQQALAPAILATGADKLTEAMATAEDQNVRRQAAAYLATLAQQGAKEDVAKAVVKHYRFDAMAEQVPWQNGPLFVPGIQWDKENAKALAGNLVKWHLWCDRHGKDAEQKQIHNNLRSLGLANAAGYQSPGFNAVGTVQWMKIWGKAFGKEEVQAMLEEQDVAGDAKYAAALKGL